MNRNAYDTALVCTNAVNAQGVANAWLESLAWLVEDNPDIKAEFVFNNAALCLIWYSWMDLVRFGNDAYCLAQRSTLDDVADWYDLHAWSDAYARCEALSPSFRLDEGGRLAVK